MPLSPAERQRRYRERHKEQVAARRRTPEARAYMREYMADRRAKKRKPKTAHLPPLPRLCTVPDCNRAYSAKSLCRFHYDRQYRLTQRSSPEKRARDRLANQRYSQSEAGRASRRRTSAKHGTAAKARYRSNPVHRQMEREREQRPETRARRSARGHEYRQQPEVIEHIRTWAKEYVKRPGVKERARAAARAYSQRPNGVATIRAYRNSDEGKAIVARAAHRRRARALALKTDADLTRSQWDAIKAAYGGRCAYCKRKVKRLEKDHILPLSKGGPLTAANVVPACHSCNSSKNDRLVPVQPVLLTD